MNGPPRCVIDENSDGDIGAERKDDVLWISEEIVLRGDNEAQALGLIGLNENKYWLRHWQ